MIRVGIMSATIILMGPIGVGKSTQAELLSAQLGKSRCCYDDVKERYWTELGLSKEKALAIEKDGVYAMISYMNRFKCRILAQIINDHSGYVIDLEGAQYFDESDQIALEKKHLTLFGIFFFCYLQKIIRQM